MFLFVYGTLRRDVGGEAYEVLARDADLVGGATYQGKLYKIESYPGAVPSEDPGDVVHGEVYRLRDAGFALSRLDEYEGCAPGFPAPTEFIREMQHVRLRSGETIPAWIYLYNRATDDLARVPSGDFLKS